MNKIPSIAPCTAAILALSAMLPAGSLAAPLALSDAPLTVTTAVDPNVMLLIDNSGSMDNIIWDSGFKPLTSYPEWEYLDGSHWVTIDSSGGNIFLSSLDSGSCASGYKRFRNASDTSIKKCLKLPDPVGSGNTRYSGNYLNYLLETYGSNTDLSSGTIPKEHRMQVARDVATSLVKDTTGMRFGVARFYGPSAHNSAHGATIDATCGSTTSTITSAIAGYSSQTNTPLAEALYEVTRYFRGMGSYYHSDVDYTSPIQYRCQKNFTIVVTDGLPTYDVTFPTDDTDDKSDPDHSLPDWDGESPNTTQAMYPNFPTHSDGFKPGDGAAGEGASLYLDDIAKFAWDIDMKKGGTDATGTSYDDPKFAKQNMYTYTVGFSTANQMLEDAANYGHGEYYTANNADELTTALQNALADIASKLGASVSGTANSQLLDAGSKVYQGLFNSKDWSGQLLAFEVEVSNGAYKLKTTNAGPEGSLWDAGAKLPSWGSRNIFTINGGEGATFRWDSLSTAQQTALGSKDILEYLRGNDALEVKKGGTFRDRATKLGDIVNSAPNFIGKPNLRYPDTLESSNPSSAQKYSEFRKKWANRTGIIYVGANDGMLHAFDADTGVEKMAYAPGALIPQLSKLSSTGYEHRYYVDGTPTVIDAFIGGAWKTVLVGGLNKGGQGIYALDVTDPAKFSESAANAANLVLWEFTDADDADLGYTYSQPAIVRLPSGKWAAVFGNGYNNTAADANASTSGNAVLYMVDLETGKLIQKFDTGVGTKQDPTNAGRPNGLATVAPIDFDGDTNIDAIYAGDLFGNLWKVEYDTSSKKWSIAPNGKPLFTACAEDPCKTRQPITERPEVGRHPKGRGVLVYFGTGKYLETGDNNGAAGGKQTFYAIWDQGTGGGKTASVSGRSVLQQQSIESETATYRLTTNNSVNWTSRMGWYLDLVPPSGSPAGERQVTNPVLRDGRIIFTTLIPTDDKCVAGGPSWLMVMDARTGSHLTYTPFDLNTDGSFSNSDFRPLKNKDGSTENVPVSGTKTEDGAPGPNVVSCGDGDCILIGRDLQEGNGGPYANGRQSWRQLGL